MGARLSRFTGFWNGLTGPSRRLIVSAAVIFFVGLVILWRMSGSIAAEETLAGTGRLEPMRLQGTWLLSAAEGSAAWLYSNDGVRFVPATRSKEQ